MVLILDLALLVFDGLCLIYLVSDYSFFADVSDCG